MDVRAKMVKYREQKHLSLDDMADICGVSRTILGMVENGDVTHPILVERIRSGYKLKKLESEELLPENRRLHGPNYDPDKYIMPDLKKIIARSPEEDEYEKYVKRNRLDRKAGRWE